LWEKAGSPPEQQDRLIDWLADAIKASTKASTGPLPPDPKFGGDVRLVPEQLVKQSAQPPAARPDAPRPPAGEILPGPELQARAPLPLRVPDPPAAVSPTKLPPEAVVVRRGKDLAGVPRLAAAAPAVVPPGHGLPPMATDDPKELTTLPAPPHRAMVVLQRQAPTAAESSAELLAKAGPDDANPQQAIGPRPPSPPPAQAQQHAEVNVEELGTRIEGINLSLRNLEAELQEKRGFTADQLDSLLSRLDILVLRQKDLLLFRDLIAPPEQAKVGQIDSSRSVVATVGTRIAELRTRIRENDAMPGPQRIAALRQLDELSDRLATMTAEK
jgi:hypothetical protein